MTQYTAIVTCYDNLRDYYYLVNPTVKVTFPKITQRDESRTTLSFGDAGLFVVRCSLFFGQFTLHQVLVLIKD